MIRFAFHCSYTLVSLEYESAAVIKATRADKNTVRRQTFHFELTPALASGALWVMPVVENLRSASEIELG